MIALWLPLALVAGVTAQCSWNLEPLRLGQVQQCFEDGGPFNSTRATLEVDVVRHAMDHYSYLDLVQNSGPPWEYRRDTIGALSNVSALLEQSSQFAEDWSFYEALSKPLRALGDSHVAVLKPQCYAIIGAQPVTPAPFYLDRQNPNQVRYFLSELTLGSLDLARTYDPGAVAFLPAREVSRSVLQMYEVLAVDGLAPAEYIASTINNPKLTSPYSHDPAASFTAALRNLQASLRLLQLDALPGSSQVAYTLRRCEAPMTGTDVDSADLTQLACAADIASNEVTLRADWLFFHTSTQRPTTASQFSRLCERQTAEPEVRVGSDCRASAVSRGIGPLSQPASSGSSQEPGWLGRAASYSSESARGAMLRRSIQADAEGLRGAGRRTEEERSSAGEISGYRSAVHHLLRSIEARHLNDAKKAREAAGVEGEEGEEGRQARSLGAVDAVRRLDDSEPEWATSRAGDGPSQSALSRLREADLARALQDSGAGNSGQMADVSTVRRLQAAESTDGQSIFEVVRTVFNTRHTEELQEVEVRRQALIADPNVTTVPTAELLLTARNYTYTSIILKIPSFSPSVLTSCFAGVDVACGTDVEFSDLDACVTSAATTFLQRGASGAYAEARARNASQIIVDVTGNDGGVVLLGRLTAAALSAQVTNVPSLAEYPNEMRPGTAVAAMARFVDQQNGIGSARRLQGLTGLEHNGDGGNGRGLQTTLTDRSFPSFPLWGLLDPLDTAVLATSPEASIAVDDVDGGHGWFYQSGDARRWGGARHPITKATKLFDLTAEMAELPADVFPRDPSELIAPIPVIIASDGMCGSTCAQFLRSLVDNGIATVLGLVASAGTAYPTSVTDSFAGGFIVQDSDSQLVLPYKEAKELGMADPTQFADGSPYHPPQFMPSSANVAYNFGSANSKRRPTYPLQFDPQRADAYTVDQSLNVAQPPSDLEFAAYLASESGLRLPYTSNPLVASATLVEAGTSNELLAQAVDTVALDAVVEDEVQRRANSTLLVLLAAAGDTVSRRDYNILLYICIALAVVAVIALLLALLLICCLGGEQQKDVEVQQSTTTLTRSGSKRTVTVRRRTIRNLKSETNINPDLSAEGADTSSEHKQSLHTRSFRVVAAKGKKGKGSKSEELASGRRDRLRGKGTTTSSQGSHESVGEFDEEIDIGEGSMAANRRKGKGGERGAAGDMDLEPEKEGEDEKDGNGKGGHNEPSPSARRRQWQRGQMDIEAIPEEEDESEATRESMSGGLSAGMVSGHFSMQQAMEKQEDRKRRGSVDARRENLDDRDYQGKDRVSHDVERHIYRHRYDERANGGAGQGQDIMHAWASPGMGGLASGGGQYRSMRHAVGSFRYGYGRPRASSPPKAIAATTKPRWESQDGTEDGTDDGSVAQVEVPPSPSQQAAGGAGGGAGGHRHTVSAETASSYQSKRSMVPKRSQRGMFRGKSGRGNFHDPLADPDHDRSPAPLRQRPSQLDVRARQAPLRVAVSFQEQSQMAARMEREQQLQRQALGQALVRAGAAGGDQEAAEAAVYAGVSPQDAARARVPGSAASPSSSGSSQGVGEAEGSGAGGGGADLAQPPVSPSTPRVRVTIGELMTVGEEAEGGDGKG